MEFKTKFVIILVSQSVQVMGTFDGWSQGEHLSSEYTGSFTTFSTTLMLRPGRYLVTQLFRLFLPFFILTQKYYI